MASDGIVGLMICVQRSERFVQTSTLAAFQTYLTMPYGGVNLDGTVMHTDIDWNDAYYGGRNLLPPDISICKTAKSPKSTALLAEVTKATK